MCHGRAEVRVAPVHDVQLGVAHGVDDAEDVMQRKPVAVGVNKDTTPGELRRIRDHQRCCSDSVLLRVKVETNGLRGRRSGGEHKIVPECYTSTIKTWVLFQHLGKCLQAHICAVNCRGSDRCCRTISCTNRKDEKIDSVM